MHSLASSEAAAPRRGFPLTPAQVQAGLAAMKVIASTPTLCPLAHELIESVASAVDVTVSVAALPAITPEELAAAISEPLWRRRVLQAMLVAACMEGQPNRNKLVILRRFADATGLAKDPWVRNFGYLVAGRTLPMKINTFIRVPRAREVIRDVIATEGAWGIAWFVATRFLHRGTSHKLAWKYRKLGLLPEGTFGRAFFEHMVRNRLPFPGERGGMPDPWNHHDLMHILTGYGTDQGGELEIASFYAGYYGRRQLKPIEDVFGWVFLTLVSFHLGIRVGPVGINIPTPMKFNPRRFLRAMRRGALTEADLTDYRDFWKLIELPLDEARRRYDLPPM